MREHAKCQEIRFDRHVLQRTQRQLLVDGEPAKLGARAFDVLLALVERAGRTVSKHELLERVWPDVVVEENNLQVQVSALRKLLGPQSIATIPGRGYRFTLPIEGGASDEPAPTAAPRTTPGNVPESLPALFGRDTDLDALLDLVRTNRVVSVVGAGGIGKTRLAQAAAHALRDDWIDGVWLVELAPITDPDLLVDTVAQALGIALPGGRPAQEELLEALRGRRALLVLDNCEHVVNAACRFVEAVATHATQVHVLATSQELLKAQDEQLLRLDALNVPGTDQLTDAADSGAVQLFVERVAALQRDFALTADNVADTVEICRRLDGLPLAIELAAARVPLLGVAGVRERLDERLRLLTGGTRSALRRHQTLREMLEWSHGLLDAADQAVFRRAGVFVGSFSLPAAQQVLADDAIDEWDVLDRLGTLVDKSLLVVEAVEPPRYRLLESARAYALEALRDAGETDARLRLHALAMRDLFEREHAQFRTVPSQVRERRCRPDIENLRAALDWARDAGEHELLVALSGSSSWLLGSSGMRLESLRRCDEALARIDRNTPLAQQARLHFARAERAWPRYEDDERAALARCIELCRRAGDRVALFEGLARLTINEARMGHIDLAERAAEEATGLLEADWPPALRAQLHVARVWLLISSDRTEQSHAELDAMARLAEAADHDYLRLLTLQYQEQLAQEQGNVERSVALGRVLFERTRRETFGHMHSYTMLNLGTALAELGQLDEALPLLRDALVQFRSRGQLATCLDVLALVAMRQRRPRDAARVLGRADAANATRFGSEKRIRGLVDAELHVALPLAEEQSLRAEGAALSDDAAARIGFGDLDV